MNTRLRRTVFVASGVLFAAWMAANFQRIGGDDDGFIRFVLGTVLSLLVLFRWKQVTETPTPRAWVVPTTGVIGALLAVFGIVFRVHQLDWLGLILLLFACLRWSLPPRFGPDIVRALVLMYWIHPLPGQLFGRMQMAMQWLSVNGAERLLHLFNVRVWADGLILRSGFQDFGVPESCSGMRTSVTVMLCTLGVGILLRLRGYQTFVFVVLGILQVLALNILRIAAMVWFAPSMPREWAETFLHDTLGIFLLVTILLVQAEASLWKMNAERRRKRRLMMEGASGERPDRATILPGFWRVVFRWWSRVTVVVLILLAIVAMAVRLRPSHRGNMIAGVIDGLVERDGAAAELALNAATRCLPADRELQSIRVRVLVRRGKFEDALQELNAMGDSIGVIDIIMKSWALMALQRPAEAMAAIATLPEKDQQLPGVAIVRAEYAALEDRPEMVSSNVVIAAKHRALAHRVRNLYPYLASREQWQAIVDADFSIPYTDVGHALIAVNANLKVNYIGGAARAMDLALRNWPDDPRFLGSLFTLAVNRPGSKWEDEAARALTACVGQLDIDRAAAVLDDCFEISRPDLAWLTYLRLKAIDPADPALYLAVARYAKTWFTFRRQRVGLKDGDRLATVDMRPLFASGRHFGMVGEVAERVPLIDLFETADAAAISKTALDRCLAELEKRNQAGKLTRRLNLMYPTVLAMAGRFSDAHTRLMAAAGEYPDIMGQIRFQQAVLYAEQEQWQEAYEALIPDYTKAERPSLMPSLLLVNTLMQLNMGVAGFHVARRASHFFPGVPETSLAIAAIWDTFGFKEEAIYTLDKSGQPPPPNVYVQLLYESGRIREAERLSRTTGITISRKPTDRQFWQLPKAELALAKRWPPALTAEELVAEGRSLQAGAKTNASPFFAALQARVIAWHLSAGKTGSDPAAWRACGRHPLEQGAALHWLGVLLARQERYTEATEAVRQAIEVLPESPILWRMQIALSGGDTNTVRLATAACPDDPEVWLSGLILRQRDAPGKTWAAAEMKRVTEGELFPLDAVIRAGDFMLASGQIDAAEIVARYAVTKARSLLPAYVMAMRCALAKRDLVWALDLATKGIEAATDPAPFYKAIVDIKSIQRSMDADMVSALEFLTDEFPKDGEWTERLGWVYFQKGDSRRTLSILKSLVAHDPKGVRVNAYILAAEAARLENDIHSAVQIMEKAYQLHPDNMLILNNLVYYLAQTDDNVPRALQLLPLLLEMPHGDSFAVMDTASLVYMRAGDLARARTYMDKALEHLDENDYSALEATLNSARVLYSLGEYREALRILERIRKNPSRNPLVDMAARELIGKVRDKIGGL